MRHSASYVHQHPIGAGLQDSQINIITMNCIELGSRDPNTISYAEPLISAWNIPDVMRNPRKR